MIRLFGLIVVTVALLALVPSSRAEMIVYVATLTGPNENPPTSSPATGQVEVDVDLVAHLLRAHEVFSGLTIEATASHIHSGAAPPGNAPVALPFTLFPSVASGIYEQTFDLTLTTTYTASFIAANGGTAPGAEAALEASLAAGTSYVDIHTSMFPGGEIRGFLQAETPEPASLTLLGTGLLAFGGFHLRRWRRKPSTT
jgi:hypothetical protein